QLEILVGVVKDHEGHVANTGKSRIEFGGQVGQAGDLGGSIGRVGVGVGRIGGGQRHGDLLDHVGGVGRIEPEVHVHRPFGGVVMVVIVIVILMSFIMI